mmetsp:Transcript_37331/g.76065  ORF Transcript_37331/g.76065 Transcript_37331/m.76065 type:complete len:263 (-) Transcript_37331:389-1177(-)
MSLQHNRKTISGTPTASSTLFALALSSASPMSLYANPKPAAAAITTTAPLSVRSHQGDANAISNLRHSSGSKPRLCPTSSCRASIRWALRRLRSIRASLILRAAPLSFRPRLAVDDVEDRRFSPRVARGGPPPLPAPLDPRWPEAPPAPAPAPSTVSSPSTYSGGSKCPGPWLKSNAYRPRESSSLSIRSSSRFSSSNDDPPADRTDAIRKGLRGAPSSSSSSSLSSFSNASSSSSMSSSPPALPDASPSPSESPFGTTEPF